MAKDKKDSKKDKKKRGKEAGKQSGKASAPRPRSASCCASPRASG
ncbi:hypothetical protein ABZ837_00575 [Streptomyces sp. NPDC047197]